ncbi:MAG: hypothetical protein EOP11_04395 [Proteobacteria bacterium]|nr:MAG: hypothetical protein EOP11_04395 [Pseudomonadota bacterium]
MKPHALVFASFLSVLAGLPAARAAEFTSPRGVNEQCLSIARVGGAYSAKDDKTEAKLCGYDIYREEIAVCPKLWSTSAGTMLYSTVAKGVSQREYEASKCGQKKGHDKLAKFKTTMNQSGTSGTFAPSSLLYYHFSRYLQTLVQVPVSVYRSFDKDEHFDRVAAKAGGMGAMNKKAWEVLRAAEKNPASYKPTRELITADGKQIYGVLLDDGGGERYGAEINGVRSKWGDAQNNDFQNTPAYLALRSEKAYAGAVQDGIGSAKGSAKMLGDLGSLHLGGVQMGIWMRELTEITLLDYIFSQQDRVGNIDFDWYWVFEKDGVIEAKKEKRDEYKNLARNKMKSIGAPEEIAQYNPVLVQKSIIGDNDAGGRIQYVNYTKKTKMLEKIRHYNAGTYQRLQALNADFQSGGTIYQHLKGSFFLDDAQIKQIVKNTAEAAQILKSTCLAGKLRFDLDFENVARGTVKEESIRCE